MAIEAPVSKYRKTNLKIYIAVCIGVALYCAYDGYFNETFKEKHTNGGKPDTTLVANKVAPPVFIGAAVLLGVYLFAIRNKRLVADENELIISDEEKIAYDSVQKIDKTRFDPANGYFIITYKNKDGSEVSRKISSKNYDNLSAVLDELVAKIS